MEQKRKNLLGKNNESLLEWSDTMLGKTLIIGVGSMGRALLTRALEKGILKASDTFVLVRRTEQLEALSVELGITGFTEMPDLDAFQTIILAVKPQVLPSIVSQMRAITEGTTVISVAAGITLDTLQRALPKAIVYRAMPNTPASIGCGMTALTTAATVDTTSVEAFFEAVGEVVVVSESDLDRLGALSGTGPGYMFVILDALADAGVRIGLPRSLAIKAAAQTMYGAGKMALSSSEHPAVLRDQVTSPGGTTIAGIGAMEKGGLRSALQDGVLAAFERSNELGK